MQHSRHPGLGSGERERGRSIAKRAQRSQFLQYTQKRDMKRTYAMAAVQCLPYGQAYRCKEVQRGRRTKHLFDWMAHAGNLSIGTPAHRRKELSLCSFCAQPETQQHINVACSHPPLTEVRRSYPQIQESPDALRSMASSILQTFLSSEAFCTPSPCPGTSAHDGASEMAPVFEGRQNLSHGSRYILSSGKRSHSHTKQARHQKNEANEFTKAEKYFTTLSIIDR
jgi:hypothetical protein